MTSWSNHPQTRLVERLKPVPAPLRAHLREGPFTFSRHDAAFDELPVLREIEKAGPAPKREGLTGSARLVFWNVERLRHLDAIAGHLQDHAPDVILLSEVDRGMARTGNTDRIAMLSETFEEAPTVPFCAKSHAGPCLQPLCTLSGCHGSTQAWRHESGLGLDQVPLARHVMDAAPPAASVPAGQESWQTSPGSAVSQPEPRGTAPELL